MPRVLATAGTLAIMRARYRRGGRRHAAAARPMARRCGRRGHVRLAPAGHVLGCAQVVMEYARQPGRRLGRLQAPARPDLRRLRAGALRRLRHRGDLRPAGVPPPARRRQEIDEAAALAARCSPSARISSGSMRSANASGVITLLRAGRLGRGRSICMARCIGLPAVRGLGVPLGECARTDGASKAELQGQHRAGAARAPSPTAGPAACPSR